MTKPIGVLKGTESLIYDTFPEQYAEERYIYNLIDVHFIGDRLYKMLSIIDKENEYKVVCYISVSVREFQHRKFAE